MVSTGLSPETGPAKNDAGTVPAKNEPRALILRGHVALSTLFPPFALLFLEDKHVYTSAWNNTRVNRRVAQLALVVATHKAHRLGIFLNATQVRQSSVLYFKF